MTTKEMNAIDWEEVNVIALRIAVVMRKAGRSKEKVEAWLNNTEPFNKLDRENWTW